MLDIKCVICQKTIRMPKVGILYCEQKRCRDEYNANMFELLKLEEELIAKGILKEENTNIYKP